MKIYMLQELRQYHFASMLRLKLGLILPDDIAQLYAHRRFLSSEMRTQEGRRWSIIPTRSKWRWGINESREHQIESKHLKTDAGSMISSVFSWQM